MTQLSEKEIQLVALLSEECTTTADLTAKLKNLFAGAPEKYWKPNWMSIWATKRTAFWEITVAIVATVTAKRPCPS